MKWYETKGRDSDVFVSSRIRLARNLKDYPFGERLDETSRREIVGKVRGVFEGDPGYTFTDFSSLPENERAAAAEENKVSPEFARSSKTRGVVESSDGVVSVMILEEDHVRISRSSRVLRLKRRTTGRTARIRRSIQSSISPTTINSDTSRTVPQTSERE